MGEKIQSAFEKIHEVAGLGERMAISIKSGIPSAQAKTIPDDLKNLSLFRQAVNAVFDDVSNPAVKAQKNAVLSLLN